jgi:hypothetical protein
MPKEPTPSVGTTARAVPYKPIQQQEVHMVQELINSPSDAGEFAYHPVFGNPLWKKVKELKHMIPKSLKMMRKNEKIHDKIMKEVDYVRNEFGDEECDSYEVYEEEWANLIYRNSKVWGELTLQKQLKNMKRELQQCLDQPE